MKRGNLFAGLNLFPSLSENKATYTYICYSLKDFIDINLKIIILLNLALHKHEIKTFRLTNCIHRSVFIAGISGKENNSKGNPKNENIT